MLVEFNVALSPVVEISEKSQATENSSASVKPKGPLAAEPMGAAARRAERRRLVPASLRQD